MSNSIAPGSSADINVKVTALTTNPNVSAQYKTIILKKNLVNGVNTLTQEMMSTANIKYVIKYDYMLGEDITVPAGCILEFDGGSISGAYTITGTNTKIKAQDIAIFNSGVIIEGTWNCPRIVSDWFGDITLNNRIKQLFNLTNETIQNTVLINDGTYNVSVDTNGGVALFPNSNTEIVLNGYIKMATNAFDSTIIIHIKNCKNVKVHGSGSLIGDKTTHTGTTGEGGDGIDITGSENIRIEDITVKDCWGDCIYIGGWDGLNKNINIFDCTLDNSRRQGISVTWAHFVNIKNCTIKNVSGTNPQYGIDLEPNHGCSVRFVWIEGCEISNCYGGIMSYSDDNNSEIGDYFVLRNNIYDIISNIAINIHTTSQHANIEENCIKGILKVYGSKVYVKHNVIEGYFYMSGNNNTFKNNSFKLTFTGIISGKNSIFTENIIEYKDDSNTNFDQVYVGEANESFISYNNFIDVKNKYGIRLTDFSKIKKAVFVGNQFYSSTPDDARFLHPDPYKCFKQSTDYPNSGTTENRPVMNGNSYDNSVLGFCYFDTTLKKPIYKSNLNNEWVDANGNNPDAKISGIFAEKPSGVKVGFRYFCTDKQTPEGTINGIEIIYKGNDVWVDALGRVIS